MSEDGSAASSASWPRHYPVEFDVDYPGRDRDRVSTAFRLVLILPILGLLGSPSNAHHVDVDIDALVSDAGGIVVVPPLLMILFRRKSASSIEPLRLSPLRISGVHARSAPRGRRFRCHACYASVEWSSVVAGSGRSTQS